jgi:hypothetical protein
VPDEVVHVASHVNPDPGHAGGLARIVPGHDGARDALGDGPAEPREHAAHGPHHGGQGQLAEDDDVLQRFDGDLADGAEDRERDGDVTRAAGGQGLRRDLNGEAELVELDPHLLECGADTDAGLPGLRLGEPSDLERRRPTDSRGVDVDEMGFEAEKRDGEHLGPLRTGGRH